MTTEEMAYLISELGAAVHDLADAQRRIANAEEAFVAAYCLVHETDFATMVDVYSALEFRGFFDKRTRQE